MNAPDPPPDPLGASVEEGPIGVILLAAGASTRLGRPKQLLVYEGETLIRRAAKAALALDIGPILVVLGAYADEITPQLNGLAVHTVLNPAWQEGMASSLRAGLAELQVCCATASAALLILVDQPLITKDTLSRLVSAYRNSPLPVAAAQYSATIGVPALFARAWFPRLEALQGDRGARRVLEAFPSEVCGVPLPEAAFDIDTPETYTQWSAIPTPSSAE